MSQLEVPLRGRTLWSTGDVLLSAELMLRLKDRAGTWKDEIFRVDTGTDITTVSAPLAQQLNLPMPVQASPGAIHVQTGLVIRSGLLRFQVVGLDATEYVVPCFFLGDLNRPPTPPQPATSPYKLLQPLGLLDQLRFHFDKDARSIGAPHGVMIVEQKGP